MSGLLVIAVFLLVPLVILASIGLIIWLVVRTVRARQQVQAAVVGWAAARGWMVGGDGPDVRAVDCRPVREGGRPGRVIRGATADGPVLVAEWTRHVDRNHGGADFDSGTPATTVERTAVAALALPPGPYDHTLVEIYRGRRPRRVAHGAPVPVEVPGVDPACTVLTGDPAGTYAVLPPEVLGRLAGALGPGAGVARRGGWLVGYREGDLDPATADALLALLHHVCADLARSADERGVR